MLNTLIEYSPNTLIEQSVNFKIISVVEYYKGCTVLVKRLYNSKGVCVNACCHSRKNGLGSCVGRMQK